MLWYVESVARGVGESRQHTYIFNRASDKSAVGQFARQPIGVGCYVGDPDLVESVDPACQATGKERVEPARSPAGYYR